MYKLLIYIILHVFKCIKNNLYTYVLRKNRTEVTIIYQLRLSLPFTN